MWKFALPIVHIPSGRLFEIIMHGQLQKSVLGLVVQTSLRTVKKHLSAKCPVILFCMMKRTVSKSFGYVR